MRVAVDTTLRPDARLRARVEARVGRSTLEDRCRTAARDNSLVFKAKVNNEAGNFNYDLMLEGKFAGSAGELTFSIRYSNAEGAEGLTLALDFAGDRDSAIQAISFHLRISPDKVEARIEIRLSVKQVFKPGVGRVLEDEEEVAA